jgi:hypothetical protein
MKSNLTLIMVMYSSNQVSKRLSKARHVISATDSRSNAQESQIAVRDVAQTGMTAPIVLQSKLNDHENAKLPKHQWGLLSNDWN